MSLRCLSNPKNSQSELALFDECSDRFRLPCDALGLLSSQEKYSGTAGDLKNFSEFLCARDCVQLKHNGELNVPSCDFSSKRTHVIKHEEWLRRRVGLLKMSSTLKDTVGHQHRGAANGLGALGEHTALNAKELQSCLKFEKV